MTRVHFISTPIQIPSGERYLALCGAFVDHSSWVAEIDLRDLGDIPTMSGICGICGKYFSNLTMVPGSWQYIYAAVDGQKARVPDE